MRYISRTLESQLIAAAKAFPAIVLTGPRRAGKTWLRRHLFPSAGYHLFEGFLATEIITSQVNAGRRRELYYFRDQQGLEVDFVVPAGDGKVSLVEAKASATVTPGMAAPMQRLATAWKKQPGTRGAVKMFVVHRAARAGQSSLAIAPGVQAVPWQEFVTGRCPV